jgi:hypothetical protein
MLESSNDRISYVFSGGYNEGGMNRTVIFSTSKTGKDYSSKLVPLDWQGNHEELPKKGDLIKQHAFPVPSKLLTASFVSKHVADA